MRCTVGRNRRYKQVDELNGIKIGLATSFNAREENDIEVLNIFPNGNEVTTKDRPYYIECKERGLRYFGREDFLKSNCNTKYDKTFPIKDSYTLEEVKEIAFAFTRAATPSKFILGMEERFNKVWSLNFPEIIIDGYKAVYDKEYHVIKIGCKEFTLEDFKAMMTHVLRSVHI